MRTTVTLEEALVAELMKIYGVKTKRQAVIKAIKEELRRSQLRKLSNLLGKIDVDEQAVDTARREDQKRAQWLDQLGLKDER